VSTHVAFFYSDDSYDFDGNDDDDEIYVFYTSVNSTFRTEFEHNDAAQLTPRTHAVASVSLPTVTYTRDKIRRKIILRCWSCDMEPTS